MHIEFTGETEKLIQAAIAEGEYSSAEKIITAMAAKWNRDVMCGSFQEIPVMPERFDLESLVAEQGAKVCEQPEELKTDLWPQDEPVDDFVHAIHEARALDRAGAE
jgi:hypothetical protein